MALKTSQYVHSMYVISTLHQCQSGCVVKTFDDFNKVIHVFLGIMEVMTTLTYILI